MQQPDNFCESEKFLERDQEKNFQTAFIKFRYASGNSIPLTYSYTHWFLSIFLRSVSHFIPNFCNHAFFLDVNELFLAIKVSTEKSYGKFFSHRKKS